MSEPISREALAKAVGMELEDLNALLDGAPCTTEQAMAIAAALDRPLDDLFDFSEEDNAADSEDG